MDEDQLRHFREVIQPRVRFRMRARLYRMLRTEHGLSPQDARHFIAEMDRITTEVFGGETQ